jgi:hypothetical protein
VPVEVVEGPDEHEAVILRSVASEPPAAIAVFTIASTSARLSHESAKRPSVSVRCRRSPLREVLEAVAAEQHHERPR